MRTKTKIVLYLILSVAAGLAAAACRSVALLTRYSVESGHFFGRAGTLLMTAFWIVSAVSVIICFFGCGLMKDRLKSHYRTAGATYSVGAMICVFATLIAFFEVLSQRNTADRTSYALSLAVALCSVVSSVALIYNACFPASGINLFRGAVTLVPAIYIILVALKIYFDPNLVMNCPNKKVYVIAAVFVALVMVYEARFNFYDERATGHLQMCCGAITFGLGCGIPNVIYYAVNNRALAGSLGIDMVFICFAFFAGAQMLSVKRDGE